MRQNLEKSLKLMFGDEGGYSNRSTDAGGPTKYGVTLKTLSAWRKQTCTAADVKTLTPEEASEIAKGGYWDAVRADDLPDGLDYAVFDFGYNSGPAQGVRSLQRVLGVAQDGVIGKQTLAAIGARPMRDLINAYCDERMRFLRGLTGKQGWASNGKGWSNRVTGVRRNALAMSAGAAVVTAVYAETPAKAPPSATGTLSTVHGRAAATTAAGGALAGVGQTIGSAKDSLTPLVGTHAWIDYGYAALIAIGGLLAIVGIVMTIRATQAQVASGAPQ